MPYELHTTGNLAFGAQRDTHIHNGVDIPAAHGTPLYAVADGTIEHANTEPASGFSGYGRTVVLGVPEDGTHHLYAHMDRVYVNEGQLVRKGQQIGTVGMTAFKDGDPNSRVDGPHVHYEVSAQRYPIANTVPRMDPVAWLTARRVHPLGVGMNTFYERDLSYGMGDLADKHDARRKTLMFAGALASVIAATFAVHHWRARRRVA